jgi:hypothetical protein
VQLWVGGQDVRRAEATFAVARTVRIPNGFAFERASHPPRLIIWSF